MLLILLIQLPVFFFVGDNVISDPFRRNLCMYYVNMIIRITLVIWCHCMFGFECVNIKRRTICC